MPNYNWVKDQPDGRDKLYQPTKLGAAINAIDLRQYCTPVEDQGYLGSCTGNAIAGAIELLNKRNRKQTDISRLFIYYYERVLEGTVNYDSGAYIRDGIKVTYTYGAPLEKYWPYIPLAFRNKPNTTAITDAAKRKVTLYQRALNHNAVIDALSNGYPVVIGFDVYESFESGNWYYTNGVMPYPNTNTEELLGGHAVLLVGFNKTTQQYIVRNSWGTSWGINGYFYMPFQVIQNTSMSNDFWVIKTVNNP